MCICSCVSNTPPTCSNLRRPEKSRGGLGICIPKSQTQGSNTLAARSAGLLMSHAGESWNNTRQGSAWRERMLEWSSSDPHPEKDPQCPERRAGEGLYLQRIAFQKDCLWLAVKLIYLPCPHMRKIIHPPSEVCIHVYINVYLSSEFMCHNYHQTCQQLLYIQLIRIPPRCSSVALVLLGSGGSSLFCPPPEWVMANREQGWRSDGQFGWATESNAITITTYFLAGR